MFREELPRTTSRGLELDGSELLANIDNTHKKIEETLINFEFPESDENSLNILTNKLAELSGTNSDDKYIFDRAWSQDQMDRIFEILNSSTINSNRLSVLLLSIFTTERKNRLDNFKDSTVSDLFAKAVVNRLDQEENGQISLVLQEAISEWCQNIQMVDKNILIDFLLAISKHPEKICPEIRHSMIMGLGLSKSLLEPLINLARNNGSFAARLKFLDIQDALLKISENSGFGHIKKKIDNVLIEEAGREDNYFLSIRAKQILDDSGPDSRRRNLALWHKYNQPDLAAQAPQPLILENNRKMSDFFSKKILASSGYPRCSKAFPRLCV